MTDFYEYNPGQISSRELELIKIEEQRFEARLQAKLKSERLARKRKSLEALQKHRVRSKWFEHLEQNNLIVRIKKDTYGREQRG